MRESRGSFRPESFEQSEDYEVIVDSQVRIQRLSSVLLRIETALEAGQFCDDATFTVTHRAYAGEPIRVGLADGLTVAAGRFLVAFGGNAATPREFVESVRVYDGENREELWRSPKVPSEGFTFPSATDPGRVWAMRDEPRAVPPPQGALPPDGDQPHSGWRIDDAVADLYLFLHDGNRADLRQEFLQLTGRIPMPPLWALGFWQSRYFPYTEQSALELIDRFRAEGFPLDVFVVDTDWRKGASRGYEINTDYFPDMARFFARAHEKEVRVVFNDHPEPKGFSPLAPGLFRYRYENLTRLVDMGLDTWWFDRNWGDIIPGPVSGIETAVWGQRIYYDIIASRNGRKRTFILSMRPEHAAGHRFPIWWTGDIFSDWASLREGMRDTLDDGERLLPWTGQDLGGHVGFPSPEQYIRWIQWGAVSPTMRIHCGPRNRFREPWEFGRRALRIARGYVRLRYRMMPLLYSLARRSYDTGEPLLQKLTAAYPEHPEAKTTSQFLLGDLMIAPVAGSDTEPPDPVDPLVLPGGFVREVAALEGDTETPVEVSTVPSVRLNPENSSANQMRWGGTYVVRWHGEFRPAETGWYRFSLVGNGTKALYLNDQGEPAEVLPMFDKGTTEVVVPMEGGKGYPVTVIYRRTTHGVAECRLSVVRVPDAESAGPTSRSVWIPPGEWIDVWTGSRHAGPATVQVRAELEKLPMFLRAGGIVPLAPVGRSTASRGWDPLTLEVAPPSVDGSVERVLYEDDGLTTGYQEGRCRYTPVRVSRDGSDICVRVGPPTGAYPEALEQRTWRVRIMLPHAGPREVRLDGDVMAEAESRGDETPSWRELPVSSQDAVLPFSEDAEDTGLPTGVTVEVTVPQRASFELALRAP